MERIERIHFFIDKLKPEGQSGKFSPEEKDEAINFAILDLFRDDIKRYDEDLDVKAQLQKFEVIKTYTSAEKTGDGYILPSDYQRFTGVGGVYEGGDEVDVDILSEMEYRKRIRSKLIPPTSTKPVCAIRSGYIVVSPDGVVPILYYIKNPTDVKFNYTLPNGLDAAYNSTGSVHPEYPATMDFEIIKGSLKYLGIPLHDEVIMAAMERFKKE